SHTHSYSYSNYYLLFLSPHPTPPHTSTLSLHDALPISPPAARTSWNTLNEPFAAMLPTSTTSRPNRRSGLSLPYFNTASESWTRSEEHTSELQSPYDLVCRLLLEKKKKKNKNNIYKKKR